MMRKVTAFPFDADAKAVEQVLIEEHGFARDGGGIVE
jgi:hypothetical protein